jgi:ADP-heptose:LPS heptosyltransferase
MNKVIFYVLLSYYRLEYFFFKWIPSKKEQSILIVRLDAIGDSIIWLDSAKEYRKHFPTKHVILLCNIAWIEIACQLPYFDEVIAIDVKKFQKSPIYRMRFLLKLTHRKFEQVINPVYSRDFFVQDTLVHNLKSNIKTGSTGDYSNTENTLSGLSKSLICYSSNLKIRADKWYSVLVESINPAMELIQNANFIRMCLTKSFQSHLPEIPFSFPSSPLLPVEEYVVLFIGASTYRKYWKMDNYTKIIQHLSTPSIVLCGGKNDLPVPDTMMKVWSQEKKIINLIGKTNLMDLFSLIREAKYIVTNDTSASHITVAVKTPSVCLLGGGHFGRFHPYQVEYLSEEDKKYLPKVVYYQMDCFNCNIHCKYIKDKYTIWPCIDNITVEQVLEKIQEIEKENYMPHKTQSSV